MEHGPTPRSLVPLTTRETGWNFKEEVNYLLIGKQNEGKKSPRGNIRSLSQKSDRVLIMELAIANAITMDPVLRSILLEGLRRQWLSLSLRLSPLFIRDHDHKIFRRRQSNCIQVLNKHWLSYHKCLHKEMETSSQDTSFTSTAVPLASVLAAFSDQHPVSAQERLLVCHPAGNTLIMGA